MSIGRGLRGRGKNHETDDPFEELLMSQVVQQEALTRLLVEKGIFTEEEFWEMVGKVDREMKRKKKVAV